MRLLVLQSAIFVNIGKYNFTNHSALDNVQTGVTPLPPPAHLPTRARRPPKQQKKSRGDFLDQFSKQFVGYTIEEMRSDPSKLPGQEVESPDNTPELKNLRKYMSKYEKEDFDRFAILLEARAGIHGLGQGSRSREEVMNDLIEDWNQMNENQRNQLIKEIPLFKQLQIEAERTKK
ncbi:hypothetical protein TELCIR_18880 [Teladorsagia circumcincta]|uniref:Uncharacterized protein n=1 Tax=Teladorsagia circumcincta TaxID=45464 RepID=A0A2G9TNR9_TELCI|nr:hypothetical protein TELCIR_18880 [Teladorsagia circumcincta]